MEGEWLKLKVLLPTIKRVHKYELGWICSRLRYCQLVCIVNKEKRLALCKRKLEEVDHFDNILWSDKCSVQLNHHGRLCFKKIKQPTNLKPRPKHPPKVYSGLPSQSEEPLQYTGRKEHFFLLLAKSFQTAIASSRTMTLNIQATTLRCSCCRF